MTSDGQAVYQALRDYLNSLFSATHPDQDLVEVPVVLRPNLEAFMRGKTEYQDEVGRRMVYAHDPAAWLSDLIHGVSLSSLAISQGGCRPLPCGGRHYVA